MEEKKVNHFPHCSTFEKDPVSEHFYCVVCGADEKNVDAYYTFQDQKEPDEE